MSDRPRAAKRMDPTDEDILARARQGDRAALDSLLRRHAETVLTHARFRIDSKWANQLTPEDVLQTTCIDAVRHIGAFQPRGVNSFVAWLRHLAENNIIDAVRGLEAEERRLPRRSAGRFGRTLDPSVSLLHSLAPAETLATPSRAMTIDDSKRTLEWAMDQLPDDHKRVVRWYDLEGRSIASIAEELGRTPGATYMIRTRAHERLREILAKRMQEIFTNP